MNAVSEVPPLELLLFGFPTVLVDGEEPSGDVLWRKHIALLAHLALSPDMERSRDHLMGLLWADRPQAKARHSLNEAIRRLRFGLGNDRLVSHGDAIRLSHVSLKVDVQRFREINTRDPIAALELVRGDFLEGFAVEDAPDFEDWSYEQRRRIGSEVATLLLRRGEVAISAGRFNDAQEDARRALARKPFWEPAANLLMRAAALSGDSSGALAAFHDFEERVKRAIGEVPGRELVELAERIRSGTWHQQARESTDKEPPLVGRPTLHQEAFAVVEEGTKSGSRCLFIAGDLGLGKTRLMTECLNRVALSGAIIATAHPLASDHDAPWSTLRLLMRNGLANAPGVAAAEPEALSVLASIVPELARRFDPLEPRDTEHVVGALESLIGAIADEHPVVLAIDNAHWADGLTMAALGATVRQLSERPVTLIVAQSTALEGEASVELTRLRSEVGRSIPGSVAVLKALEDEEMHELVSHMATWCESPAEVDRLARRIDYESAGNPFLAVTLLQSLDRAPTLKEDLLQWPAEGTTLDSPLPFSVPDLVRVAIVARVSVLDEDSMAVLRAASIGGLALDTRLLQLLAELPPTRIEKALDVLERKRFLTYDMVRYWFTAPLFAQVVRSECLTRGQRQRLRRRAIEELERRDDLESRVLVAELASKVNPCREVADQALAVAKEATKSGSRRTAERALAAAERIDGKNGVQLGDEVSELRSLMNQS
ncbi:MAG: AAA family ATPase [Gemmatimonadota bacterium]|nr:MAG: AAA family ATPase [Gemmatimonadota bacterium]